MSVTLIKDDGNRYQVVTDNEPLWVIPLQAAPIAIEPFLLKGNWLLCAFSIWSIDERTAVRDAIELLKEATTTINLGLRPFDQYNECSKWLWQPHSVLSLGDEHPSPMYAVLENGKERYFYMGRQSKSQLKETLKNLGYL